MLWSDCAAGWIVGQFDRHRWMTRLIWYPDCKIVGAFCYYTIPTIFANVTNDWRLAREEIFGPVLVAKARHDARLEMRASRH
jgi:Aldehyde dehydrogenase family